MSALSTIGERYPKDLLVNLTLRELRSKYKRSTLGWAWSVVNPAVTILVYTMVFSVFLGQPDPVGDPSGLESFPLWLMCGLLPWLFVSNGITGSVSSLTANEGLIKKVYFPRSILPTSNVISWLATFAIEMGVLCVLLLVFARSMVLPWIPAVVAIAFIQLFMILGIGLLVSPINAYFRDVEHFTNIALMVWFWATPILYPWSLLEGKEIMGIPVTSLMKLNPLAHFTTAYRNLLYDLRFPALTTWAAMIVSAVIAMAVGTTVFRRLEPNLAEEL